MSLRERILEVLKENENLRERELEKIIGVNQTLKKEFRKTLSELEKEGLILQEKRDRYQVVDGVTNIVGQLQGNDKGFGFLLTPVGEEDVYIDRRNMKDALHGDTVLVRVIHSERLRRRREGEVLQILKRGNTKLVGTYQEVKGFGFVLPDENKFSKDIYIHKSNLNGAKNGQKVLVKITKWPEKGKNPEGVIDEILGYPDEKGVDILSVVKEMNLPTRFSKKVIGEAKEVPQEVLKKDMEDRVDYRELVTFTIDGADSKDFDDAVSIEKLDNGNYILGVHIADVAHYVKEGMSLDKEAYKRGNSVYLLDVVLPMLPKELSNGICSLNEGVDRLTLSVMMEINEKGNVLRHTIEEGIINSRRRLVYTDVSNYLEQGIVEQSISGLEDELTAMGELASLLRKKRDQRGAIDFNLPERSITLDETGHPVDVKLAERRIANRMIEEFMLLTNETIAEEYHWMDVPFLFRIHEDPDEEKMKALNVIMRPFGHKLRHTDDIKPMEIQQLLTTIEGTKEYPLIEMLVLRSLKKAKYSADMEGHFGLASTYYTHFTSPIRRYNDLMIHRIIKEIKRNGISKKKIERWENTLPQVAEHISATEKLAQVTERTVDNIKIAEYMEGHIGEIHEGLISGINSFGIFVQLENTVEGLVSFASIDDYVSFDEDKYQAICKNSNEVYSLGDVVTIEVVGASKERGQVDFVLVGDGKNGKEKQDNSLATNRKARHEYYIEDTLEVGISLKGTEVKSIRKGKVNLSDAFGTIEGGEVYVEGMHISPYEQGNIFNVDPLRKRKLLLHKSEIRKLDRQLKLKGYTLVPLKLYLKNGKVKMELATARGKKLYDKRESIAQRDSERKLRDVVKY